MAEELNERKGQDAGDADAKPTSSQPDPQSSEVNFAELIANLQKKIDAQDGEIRALKSGKDKAVDRVVKSQEETLAKLAKYLDIDETKVREAQRQSVLDELVEERIGSKGQPNDASQGSGAAQGNKVELQYIDTALDLPANDSRVTDLKLKHGGDPVTYLREAMTLAQSFKNQTSPTPAEQLPPQGSQPPKADLMKEFEARAKGLRGNDLINLKMEFRKKGLAIT